RQVRAAGVLADLVDADDVGVVEPGRRLGLDAEPGPRLRPGQGAVADQLERDRPPRSDLPGLVDDAHPAAADLLQDLVARDARPVRRLLARRPVAGDLGLAHRASSSPAGAGTRGSGAMSDGRTRSVGGA